PPELDVFWENHPHATVMTNDCATRSAALAALDDAPVAHIVAHGVHEPANAMFSSVELSDGPLLAHEITDLVRPPEHVVLGASELALTTHRNGDPLGFAGALLTGGTRTVVAALTRVGHISAGVTLTEYHRALATGLSPAAALAAATAEDPVRRPFVCLGWGG
ncbi:MAG: CHAT domain-containing protein, partial [Actinomycetota bacterium]|nr:CHAT domain-containing protein [Actinomycetota bacterium]